MFSTECLSLSFHDTCISSNIWKLLVCTVRCLVFFFSLVQLLRQVWVLYDPPPSSPVVGVSPSSRTCSVIPDVVDPPHSWSSSCPGTSHNPSSSSASPYSLHPSTSFLVFLLPWYCSQSILIVCSTLFSSSIHLILGLPLALVLLTIHPHRLLHLILFIHPLHSWSSSCPGTAHNPSSSSASPYSLHPSTSFLVFLLPWYCSQSILIVCFTLFSSSIHFILGLPLALVPLTIHPHRLLHLILFIHPPHSWSSSCPGTAHNPSSLSAPPYSLHPSTSFLVFLLSWYRSQSILIFCFTLFSSSIHFILGLPLALVLLTIHPHCLLHLILFIHPLHSWSSSCPGTAHNPSSSSASPYSLHPSTSFLVFLLSWYRSQSILIFCSTLFSSIHPHRLLHLILFIHPLHSWSSSCPGTAHNPSSSSAPPYSLHPSTSFMVFLLPWYCSQSILIVCFTLFSSSIHFILGLPLALVLLTIHPHRLLHLILFIHPLHSWSSSCPGTAHNPSSSSAPPYSLQSILIVCSTLFSSSIHLILGLPLALVLLTIHPHRLLHLILFNPSSSSAPPYSLHPSTSFLVFLLPWYCSQSILIVCSTLFSSIHPHRLLHLILFIHPPHSWSSSCPGTAHNPSSSSASPYSLHPSTSFLVFLLPWYCSQSILIVCSTLFSSIHPHRLLHLILFIHPLHSWSSSCPGTAHNPSSSSASPYSLHPSTSFLVFLLPWYCSQSILIVCSTLFSSIHPHRLLHLILFIHPPHSWSSSCPGTAHNPSSSSAPPYSLQSILIVCSTLFSSSIHFILGLPLALVLLTIHPHRLLHLILFIHPLHSWSSSCPGTAHNPSSSSASPYSLHPSTSFMVFLLPWYCSQSILIVCFTLFSSSIHLILGLPLALVLLTIHPHRLLHLILFIHPPHSWSSSCPGTTHNPSSSSASPYSLHPSTSFLVFLLPWYCSQSILIVCFTLFSSSIHLILGLPLALVPLTIHPHRLLHLILFIHPPHSWSSSCPGTSHNPSSSSAPPYSLHPSTSFLVFLLPWYRSQSILIVCSTLFSSSIHFIIGLPLALVPLTIHPLCLLHLILFTHPPHSWSSSCPGTAHNPSSLSAPPYSLHPSTSFLVFLLPWYRSQSILFVCSTLFSSSIHFIIGLPLALVPLTIHPHRLLHLILFIHPPHSWSSSCPGTSHNPSSSSAPPYSLHPSTSFMVFLLPWYRSQSILIVCSTLFSSSIHLILGLPLALVPLTIHPHRLLHLILFIHPPHSWSSSCPGTSHNPSSSSAPPYSLHPSTSFMVFLLPWYRSQSILIFCFTLFSSSIHLILGLPLALVLLTIHPHRLLHLILFIHPPHSWSSSCPGTAHNPSSSSASPYSLHPSTSFLVFLLPWYRSQSILIFCFTLFSSSIHLILGLPLALVLLTIHPHRLLHLILFIHPPHSWSSSCPGTAHNPSSSSASPYSLHPSTSFLVFLLPWYCSQSILIVCSTLFSSSIHLIHGLPLALVLLTIHPHRLLHLILFIHPPHSWSSSCPGTAHNPSSSSASPYSLHPSTSFLVFLLPWYCSQSILIVCSTLFSSSIHLIHGLPLALVLLTIHPHRLLHLILFIHPLHSWSSSCPGTSHNPSSSSAPPYSLHPSTSFMVFLLPWYRSQSILIFCFTLFSSSIHLILGLPLALVLLTIHPHRLLHLILFIHPPHSWSSSCPGTSHNPSSSSAPPYSLHPSTSFMVFLLPWYRSQSILIFCFTLFSSSIHLILGLPLALVLLTIHPHRLLHLILFIHPPHSWSSSCPGTAHNPSSSSASPYSLHPSTSFLVFLLPWYRSQSILIVCFTLFSWSIHFILGLPLALVPLTIHPHRLLHLILFIHPPHSWSSSCPGTAHNPSSSSASPYSLHPSTSFMVFLLPWYRSQSILIVCSTLFSSSIHLIHGLPLALVPLTIHPLRLLHLILFIHPPHSWSSSCPGTAHNPSSSSAPPYSLHPSTSFLVFLLPWYLSQSILIVCSTLFSSSIHFILGLPLALVPLTIHPHRLLHLILFIHPPHSWSSSCPGTAHNPSSSSAPPYSLHPSTSFLVFLLPWYRSQSILIVCSTLFSSSIHLILGLPLALVPLTIHPHRLLHLILFIHPPHPPSPYSLHPSTSFLVFLLPWYRSQSILIVCFTLFSSSIHLILGLPLVLVPLTIHPHRLLHLILFIHPLHSWSSSCPGTAHNPSSSSAPPYSLHPSTSFMVFLLPWYRSQSILIVCSTLFSSSIHLILGLPLALVLLTIHPHRLLHLILFIHPPHSWSSSCPGTAHNPSSLSAPPYSLHPSTSFMVFLLSWYRSQSILFVCSTLFSSSIHLIHGLPLALVLLTIHPLCLLHLILFIHPPHSWSSSCPGTAHNPSSSSASPYSLHPSAECVHTSTLWLASLSMWCFPLPNLLIVSLLSL